MTLLDERICALGEGALWHPDRQELFWFDITGRRLLSRRPNGGGREWALSEMCSAAARIDRDRLLIASETALSVFDIEAGRIVRRLAWLEAGETGNRSNDGRADPWGGFWIGTMGKGAEPGAGAIYRCLGGRVERLVESVTIPNAICFSPDRRHAYYADTALGQIFRVGLDAGGWPTGAGELFIDLGLLGFAPDGAVTLNDGSLMVALWGEGAVLMISADGEAGARIPLPAPHLTCPAMGGAEFSTLFCTSATEGLSAEDLARAPLSGATFRRDTPFRGRPEPAFDLTPFGDPA